MFDVYTTILGIVQARPWVMLWAIAVGLMVRTTKPDAKGPTIPPFLRAPLAVALGLAGGLLDHLAFHTAWGAALEGGIAGGIYAVLGHVAIVQTLRKGQEIVLPASLQAKPGPAIVEGDGRSTSPPPGPSAGADP